MTLRSGFSPSDDPLDRLQDALRELKPRAVSPQVRTRVAAQLDRPATIRRQAPARFPRMAASIALFAATATLAGWVVMLATPIPNATPSRENRPKAAEAIAFAGCDCQIHFSPPVALRATP